jgi:hypothetical protein
MERPTDRHGSRAPTTRRKHARVILARVYLKRWVAGSYRSPVTFISRDRSKD